MLEKNIVNESRRVFRYPRRVNDIWKKLFREKKVNKISSWCVRVKIQKINIKIPKDKNLFFLIPLDWTEFLADIH